MSQDTRKDQRAKVVSLNVRYKSATVDEFIENHSHDVSKGGLFVKTPTPFPPGTLLKFEIRLAGDKSVIAGVGRVVWKREAAQAGAEKPAGMGVKFIKIDDASRAVIDKLVAQKPEGGGAFESEVAQSLPPPAEGEHHATLRGIPAAAPVGSSPPPGTTKRVPVSVPPPAPQPSPAPPKVEPATSAPPAAAAKPAAKFSKAATMMGVAPPAASLPVTPSPPEANIPTTPPPAKMPSVPPRPQIPARRATVMGVGTPSTAPRAPAQDVAATPMFPDFSAPESSPHQVQEPTVMKQAAELLEEALKEAGGSLDDIGQNPLFNKPEDKQIRASYLGAQPPTKQSGDTMLLPEGAAPIGPPPQAASVPPPAAAPAPVPARDVAPAKLSAQVAPAPKKSSTGLVVGLGALLLAGGGVFAWKSGMLGGGDGVAPAPSATTNVVAAPSASAAPAASAAPTASAAPAASTTADAPEAGAAMAAPTASASAAAAPAPTPEVVKPVAPVAPRPIPAAPRPTPRPQPTAAPTGDTPPAGDEPAPAPTAAPTAVPTAPTATAAPTAEPTPAPTPAPTAKPPLDPEL